MPGTTLPRTLLRLNPQKRMLHMTGPATISRPSTPRRASILPTAAPNTTSSTTRVLGPKGMDAAYFPFARTWDADETPTTSSSGFRVPLISTGMLGEESRGPTEAEVRGEVPRSRGVEISGEVLEERVRALAE